MKKILKYFVFFAFIVFPPFLAFAQTPPPPPNSALQRWFCLKPTRAGTHASSLVVKDGVVIDVTRPTYVVAKIALNVGDTNPGSNMSAMTTGKANLDTHVFNSTQGLIDLQQKLGFNGGVSQGSNPTSSFPITWTDDLSKTSGASDERAHFWYGMQESVPTSTGGNGDLGAQQQGTFTFDQAHSANDCTYISWDPSGYVFDSVTLGPVMGVYVRLLTSLVENGTFNPVPVGIGAGKVPQNPVVTNSDGSYKFYVDPGFYKLELLGDITNSLTKYTIEKDSAKITPGYEQFGYQQLYLAQTPEVINEQAGTVARRDIAIETIGAPAPFSVNGPKLTDSIINRSVQNGITKVRVSGRALFIPMDLTAIYTDLNNTILDQKTFSIIHGHTYIPQNSTDERNFDIWMDETTKDSKGILTQIKVTSKYSTKFFTIPIDPMPSYLEGIAKDKTDKPILEGTVSVFPIGSSNPTFKTTADIHGHFIITSANLPPLPYSLLYTTITGDEIKISTTEYLKQNVNFHKTNAINSYSVKTLDHKTSVTNNPLRQPTTGDQKQGTASTGGQMIILTFVILIILIATAAGAFLVMKSKRQQVPPAV